MNWTVFWAALVVIPAAAFLGCLAAAGMARVVDWWIEADENAKTVIDAAVFVGLVFATATAAALVIP